MVSKEEFNKVWKDSSRENILNQFYYEHNELFRIKKEIREKCIGSTRIYGLRVGKTFVATLLNDILEILDKEVN